VLLELPTTVQWSQEQKKDADLQIWYEWITEQKKPSPENPHFQFWYRDKENVVLDENDVLVRLTRFSTTTRSHVCKQILVPKVYQDRILYLAHGHVTSGHQGVSRTFLKLREQFYWETMKRDINHYILNCPCRGIKQRNAVPRAPYGSLLSTIPNDLVAIDCTGPLLVTGRGNKYIIVIQDHFTKFVEAAAVPAISATVICDVLFKHWIKRYGPMECFCLIVELNFITR